MTIALSLTTAKQLYVGYPTLAASSKSAVLNVMLDFGSTALIVAHLAVRAVKKESICLPLAKDTPMPLA